MVKTGAAVALVALLAATACGGAEDQARLAISGERAPGNSAPAGSESVGTPDADWDTCLVTGPEGREDEWLNHETWMSLERQRREIGRSLHPDGEATTARATPAEAAAAAARRHPDVDFIGIDQYYDVDLPNLAGLVFPEDRAGFLVGALAASATVTGLVAVVLDSPTDPASVGYRTGFANGVAHIDPDVEVLVITFPGHPGEGAGESGGPDAAWGASAASAALDGGADGPRTARLHGHAVRRLHVRRRRPGRHRRALLVLGANLNDLSP